jgi:hypothetical protein
MDSTKPKTGKGLMEQMDKANTMPYSHHLSRFTMIEVEKALLKMDQEDERKLVIRTGEKGMEQFQQSFVDLEVEAKALIAMPMYNDRGKVFAGGLDRASMDEVTNYLNQLEK